MKQVKDKLYGYEEAAPAGAWEKIALSLDESAMELSFPNRLNNAEVLPPAGTWEKLAARISSDNEEVLAAKLYAMEVDPPVQTWQHIEQGLSGESESRTPVWNLRTIWRYAAAAVFIGAIAFGIFRTTLQRDTRETAGIITKDTNNEVRVPQQQMVVEVPSISTATVSSTPELPKKMIASVGHSRQPRKQAVINAVRHEERAEASLAQSIYAYADHVPDISERYVMLMTPDGNIIRMSKKLAPLLCCVSGEDQDAGCKSQLKKWQEKMATSNLAPSPSNFMDILGLVDALDESNDL